MPDITSAGVSARSSEGEEDTNMGSRVVYMAEYLNHGHLSFPKEIADKFTLKGGSKVRVTVETEEFNKAAFLELFGVWSSKSDEELDRFKKIFSERKNFGRGDVSL